MEATKNDKEENEAERQVFVEGSTGEHHEESHVQAVE